jgi:carboxylesterase type B
MFRTARAHAPALAAGLLTAPRWPGTRPADHHGSPCASPGDLLPPRSEAEDCLYLDVQRQAGTAAGARLPVYLWIHGGGLVGGSGNPYDGRQLVRRTGPGVTAGQPGYVWGAGHGAELQYLWRFTGDAFPADRPFTAAERRLSSETIRYWGAFVRHGRPDAPGRRSWPRHDDAWKVLSLRAGGRSTVLADATLAAQRRCGSWDAGRRSRSEAAEP